MSEVTFLTKDGYQRLKKELKALRGSKRREIAAALEKARLLGDLSETAEYESAKQAQDVNEKRIHELENKLAMARIIEDENIASDKAYIGAKVILTDLDSREEIEYTLVAEDEADFAQGKISISSPVGKALLGKEKGDVVSIRVPAGSLKYEIKGISR